MQKNLIWKTSENVFLGHLGEWVFHIFLRLHSIIGSALPQIPIRILWIMLNIEFKPYVAKVELFVTKKFFMNVIGLLALTLKHIDKFRLRQQSIPSKDTRTTSCVSIVKFEHIFHFTDSITEFKEVNAGWPWEIVVSDNKFVL